jgi:hypothetical protein
MVFAMLRGTRWIKSRNWRIYCLDKTANGHKSGGVECLTFLTTCQQLLEQ